MSSAKTGRSLPCQISKERREVERIYGSTFRVTFPKPRGTLSRRDHYRILLQTCSVDISRGVIIINISLSAVITRTNGRTSADERERELQPDICGVAQSGRRSSISISSPHPENIYYLTKIHRGGKENCGVHAVRISSKFLFILVFTG